MFDTKETLQCDKYNHHCSYINSHLPDKLGNPVNQLDLSLHLRRKRHRHTGYTSCYLTNSIKALNETQIIETKQCFFIFFVIFVLQ